MYVSFFEFGATALASEDGWLPVSVCRSSVVKEANGGIAQLVGNVLALVFPEMSATGLFLTAGDESMRLFAKLSTVVQDLAYVSYIVSHPSHNC